MKSGSLCLTAAPPTPLEAPYRKCIHRAGGKDKGKKRVGGKGGNEIGDIGQGKR